uniref:N-acetyltransferase domain-containing protein n=1 Tax=Mucochytrium quahogii TaxID=96639 RepID=A0A7S2R7A8_9STRA|mmetsp:Transcript_14881/g.24234  ORF Transcript_14881/g.24234 Transcript_14881/m.24234 type:complete len:158 (-) Transcript_14881:145-618(-)
MGDNEVNIRQGALEDLDVLVDFQLKMAWVTEERKLDKDTVTRGVKRILDDKDKSKGFYIVAENKEKQIMGSCMVTYEWSDWQAKDFYWIQSVFVDENHRRKGIYRKLYSRVKELAIENNASPELRLYVENTNETAQKAYKALGMNQSHYLIYDTMLN